MSLLAAPANSNTSCSWRAIWLLARDLGFLQTEAFDRMTADVQEVKRMLTALISRLKADS
jgi:hypothetical protein